MVGMDVFPVSSPYAFTNRPYAFAYQHTNHVAFPKSFFQPECFAFRITNNNQTNLLL